MTRCRTYFTDRYVRSVTASTREALLTSAGALFYDDGITATGVDAVVRHAGVTKPTLYAHFRSKSELVAAVLRRRHEERRVELDAWLSPLSRAERPLAVFDWLQEFYTQQGRRGCGFLNAAAELTDIDATARAAVQQEKDWLRDLLVEACARAGCRAPELLGSQLLLLIDGVAGRAVVGGRAAGLAAAKDAREAAAMLLAVAQ